MSDKKKFWVQVVLWFIFAYVIPASYMIYRYNLFQVMSKVNLSGGAILLGILTFSVLFVILKYVVLKGAYARWKYIVKMYTFLILPLGLCLYTLVCARDEISRLIEMLGCVVICEAIAIPINPLPDYAHEKSKGETSDMVALAFDKWERKKADKVK
jgi:hypothetical protein